jgi:hypothetical protein
VEVLEALVLPSVFTVTTTGDSGTGSLRKAITDANNHGGFNTIDFNIPGSGVHTMQPLSGLPSITGSVLLDGTSQPGYAGTPLIELDGSMAGTNGVTGLYVASNGSTIKGFVINRFSGTGIIIIGSDNVIQSNYIGTDPTGTVAEGNLQAGVSIFGGGQSNLVGTNGDGVNDSAERNIISANQGDGVDISGTNTNLNVVAGNYIGTDPTGTVAEGNLGNGISIFAGSQANLVGTSGDGVNDSAERNIISANQFSGVSIAGLNTNANIVAGNYIGTNAAGTAALGNASSGVAIYGEAQSNRIGSSASDADPAGEANLISGNAFSGVLIAGTPTNLNVVTGNLIGTDATGAAALGNSGQGVALFGGASSNDIGAPGLGNTIAFNKQPGVTVQDPTTTANSIRGNSIYGNGGLGIDLNWDGVTLNDAGDGDDGPNRLQNYPTLISATPGTTTAVSGTLNSLAGTTFSLDFYASAAPDPTLFGQGQRYLGSSTVTTDAGGNAHFSVTLAAASSAGEWISATATDPSGNTSEFALSLQLPTPALSLSSTTWTPIGPAPITLGGVPGSQPVSGRIAGIATDPTNANIIYLAAGGGGVWKTTNGGASWSPLTDNQASLTMGAIALAPSNPKVIYAGTGTFYYGRGVLKSTNGGATWTLLTGNAGKNEFDRHTISRIVVDPTNAQVVYVAIDGGGTNGLSGNTGIWKSTDGGTTWTNTTASISTTDAYTDLVLDPHHPSTLYAAVGTYTGSSVNGLYETTNGGKSWSPIASFPGGSGDGTIRIALAPSNDQTLYASIATTGFPSGLREMLKSTDAGSTWMQLSPPDYLYPQANSDSTLAVDPSNANIVYAGGTSNGGGPDFIESADGGNTWTNISTGASGTNGVHTDEHAIAFDANGKLIDGNDGGVWRLDNPTIGSIHWTDLNTNLQITQFIGIALNPTNPALVLGGNQDNGTVMFTGSSEWITVRGGDGGFAQIDSSNPSTMYHTYPYGPGFVERSTDGGATWSDATNGIYTGDPANFYVPYVMDPSKSSRLILGTNRVYETTNQAASWLPISTPDTNGWTGSSPIDCLAIAPSDGKTIYASAGGHIFVTFNDGAGWQQIDIPGFSDHFQQLAVDPANKMTAYAVRDLFTGGSGGHVFMTTDGGQHWTDISGNLPDVPTNTLALDPRTHVLYVGTDAGVYASNDGGTMWAPFAIGMPNVRVTQLVLNTTESVLAAATYGRGVWEIGITRFTVTAPTSITAGKTFSITVKAVDDFNNPIPGYTGTVHFTSTDASATLPADYTFISSDNGTHTFKGVVLRKAGRQQITATDTVISSLTGSATIKVNPAAATHFAVSAPSSVTVGTAFTITVTALDQFGNVATGYRGTVTFTSSDGSAVLPGNYTFTSADKGTHSFSVTLNTVGSQTITAADTVTTTIQGTASVTVNASGRAAGGRDPFESDFEGLNPAGVAAFFASARSSRTRSAAE